MSDPLLKPLEQFGERTVKALGHDAGKAGEKVVHEMGDGLEKVSTNAVETEAKHAGEMDAIGKARQEIHGDIGDTPVYRMRDDGTVERLTRDGPQPLEAADRDRLNLDLDGDDKAPSRQTPKGTPNPHNLPKVRKGTARPRVTSTKTPLGEGDLAKATQLARHEDGSYGNYKKDVESGGYDFESNNYAAVRHGEKGADGSYIMVGRSDNPVHSERVLGVPYLRSGSEHGITEVYTEREPCTNDPHVPGTPRATTTPNCAAWMHHFLPKNVQVSHSVEYGATDASKAAGNSAMENYLNGLNPRPSKHAPAAP
ncbi:nucleic acid/nucleotide deaminase domain-containing protein [Streptacidiphilus sp. PAMC 29251]